MARNNRKLQKKVSKALGSKKNIRGEKFRQNIPGPNIGIRKEDKLGEFLAGLKKKFTKKKKSQFNF